MYVEQGGGVRHTLVLLEKRGMKEEGLAKLEEGGEQLLREKPPWDDMREEENTLLPLVLLFHQSLIERLRVAGYQWLQTSWLRVQQYGGEQLLNSPASTL